MLYYAGHGERHRGGIVLNSSECLYLSDLLLEFGKVRDHTKMLLIVADSCFSGKLCEEHQEALRSGNCVAERVGILAATLPGQTARELIGAGGRFTKWFLSWVETTPLREQHHIKQNTPALTRALGYTGMFKLHNVYGKTKGFQTACCSFPALWVREQLHDYLVPLE